MVKQINKIKGIMISILLILSLVSFVLADDVLLTTNWSDGEDSFTINQGDTPYFTVWITVGTNHIEYIIKLYDSTNDQLISTIYDYNAIGYSYYNNALNLDTSNLDGDYYLKITAGDGTGDYSTNYLFLTVNTNAGQNNAPTNPTGSIISPSILFVEDTLVAQGQGSTDLDGDNVVYYYKFSNTQGTIQDWSVDNDYYINPNNAHETISIEIKAYDGEAFSEGSETLTIDVSNSLPSASNVIKTLIESTSIHFDLHGTDVDEDHLEFYLYTFPNHGSTRLNIDGSVTYTPRLGYVGEDSFSYRIYDGFDYSNIAVVSLTISQNGGESNHGPENLEANYPRDGAKNIKLNPFLDWNCEDVDGDVLTYDLYFGEDEDNLELIVRDLTNSKYLIEDLDYSNWYYWKIVAKDETISLEGDIWKFKTKTSGSGGSDDNDGTGWGNYFEGKVYGVCLDDFDGDEFGVRTVTSRIFDLVTGSFILNTIEESCYLGDINGLYEYGGKDYLLILLIALIFLIITIPISIHIYKKLI
jgi:hypothetical protein